MIRLLTLFKYFLAYCKYLLFCSSKNICMKDFSSICKFLLHIHTPGVLQICNVSQIHKTNTALNSKTITLYSSSMHHYINNICRKEKHLNRGCHTEDNKFVLSHHLKAFPTSVALAEMYDVSVLNLG